MIPQFWLFLLRLEQLIFFLRMSDPSISDSFFLLFQVLHTLQCFARQIVGLFLLTILRKLESFLLKKIQTLFYVGYSPFHQKFSIVSSPKKTTILHSARSTGDSFLLDYISCLSTRDLPVDVLFHYLEETLLQPFNFLKDCKFSDNEIYYSYLHHLGGTAPNFQILIQSLTGENSSKYAEAWNQVHYLGIFAFHLKQMLFSISSGAESVKYELKLIVSCVPLCSIEFAAIYKILLRALKLGIDYEKEKRPVDKNIHYLILDVVGPVGYSHFCDILEITPSLVSQQNELVQSFFNRHLITNFSMNETKASQLVFEIERFQDIWEHSAFSESIDLSKFRPPAEYRNHLHNIFQQSKLLL